MTAETEIRIPIEGSDPGFNALENLIICDLVNNDEYMKGLLNYRVGDTAFEERYDAHNYPDETVRSDDADRELRFKPSVADVLAWHEHRPWRRAGYGLKSQAWDVARQPSGYTCGPDDVGQSAEPKPEDFHYFLWALSGEYDGPDPELRKRQREMLALLAERFGGVLQIGTGRRIMQSLTMFVDLTVRKDGKSNRLMW